MTFQNTDLAQICFWMDMALNSSCCLEGFLSLLQANHFSLRAVKALEAFPYIKKGTQTDWIPYLHFCCGKMDSSAPGGAGWQGCAVATGPALSEESRHGWDIAAAWEQPSEIGVCCPSLCCPPCNQMTSKRSENWEDNSTALPSLCFLGCWKCCISHKEIFIELRGPNFLVFGLSRTIFQMRGLPARTYKVQFYPHATSPCHTEYQRGASGGKLNLRINLLVWHCSKQNFGLHFFHRVVPFG